MGGLLRGKEQPEITQLDTQVETLFHKAFDYHSNAVLFPVRHHSPACSYHLKNVIQQYQPEIILIEGPENASELIPFAASEKTKPPFCIYLSFDDKDGKISEEKDKYRAYYPFLDYSPELVAIREANKRAIECRFIDLSYGEKLLNTPKISKAEQDETQDSTFLLGDYHKKLAQSLNCKSFSELWEMLFEINGCHLSTEQFVQNLFTYCYYSRSYTKSEELVYHGDIIREYTMTKNIRTALEQFQKVLVVTGGIHTIALVEQIWADEIPEQKLIRSKKENSPCYLMPYSFEASDQNSGYDSGMIFPFFYQKVWESMQKKLKTPYEDTVMRFIINTARQVRKKQALSIADEIQSFYMARGLAQLREKRECGVFEAIDSVKASFVKGEINSLYQPALKTLYQLMTGMEMGVVDSNAGVPPIVNDFLEQCKKFKIQTNTSLKKETRLDTNNNEQHRQKSQFFHQMNYLNTEFSRCLKSQDSNSTTGRILLRETWEYRFSPSVQVNLISVSAYGGTVKQSALTLLSKEIIQEHNNTKTLSELLLKANQMGLDEIYSELLNKLFDIIGDDMDFFSIMDGFQNLCSVKKFREMFEGVKLLDMENVLTLCLNRLMTLMYTIRNIKKENEDKACSGLKFLYGYFVDGNDTALEENFLQNMTSIHQDIETNGALAGISAAILYKKNICSLDEVMDKLNSYLNGSDDAKKLSASFLKGFFKVAKDVVFVDDRLLLSLDKILQETSGEQFLSILPDLRLAFTDFMLFETDKIAKQVSSFYQVSKESILYQKAFDQKSVEMATTVDKYCQKIMDEWLWTERG